MMKHLNRAMLSVIAMSAVTFSCGSRQDAAETKNVFGNDDRIALTTNQYPWSTIGLLNNGKGTCTATLVYKDIVVTAAHCVIDPATKKLVTTPISFQPNYKGGSSATKTYASYVWWGTNDPDKFRSSDFALIRLQQPVGSQYGWLGTHATNVGSFPAQLTVAGYSGDFMNGQTAGIHHNCNTRGRDSGNGFILHDCDTARGSSGGPALRMYNNGLTIFGLNVAERRNGGDTSLHLPTYDDAHANIVIPSEGMVHKLQEILAGH
jgi:V8-like Glu-specific endopeptidase